MKTRLMTIAGVIGLLLPFPLMMFVRPDGCGDYLLDRGWQLFYVSPLLLPICIGLAFMVADRRKTGAVLTALGLIAMLGLFMLFPHHPWELEFC